MSFLEDIDKGLRKMAKKIDDEDPAYIQTSCPHCEHPMKVHKMRARHGHVVCTECKRSFVIMMERR